MSTSNGVMVFFFRRGGREVAAAKYLEVAVGMGLVLFDEMLFLEFRGKLALQVRET